MKSSSIAYLLLGTNLGNREANLQLAYDQISGNYSRITKTSTVYETAPWGVSEQPDFLNQVIEIETDQTPQELLKTCQAAENFAGPVKSEKWGARYLDIDILFYDDKIIETKELHIPHPQLHTRKFTLVPLAEIAPDLIHPVLNKSISQLLAELDDPLEVKPYSIHAS